MEGAKENYIAGILIPTMNRVDFVIRQLRYYAAVRCPHTIYIGDSSPKKESEKIKNEIEKLSNSVKAKYYHLPEHDDWQAYYYLINKVQEKYVCYSGDDDYQIPNSVTKCIKFLETHPEYTSASGHAVSFRLKQNSPYGELKRLADYPRQQIENETSSERIENFFRDYYVTLFSVNKTDDQIKYWGNEINIQDRSFRGEIIPAALPLIHGKSKIIDCLGFVRQIHDSHYQLPNTFDWVTSPNWHQSYSLFEQTLSKNLSEKDNIPTKEAVEIIRQSFLGYLAPRLNKEYESCHQTKKQINSYAKLVRRVRLITAATLPFIKHAYRAHIKPKIKKKKEMHYETLKIGSQYYEDFKPVMESFTDSSLKNL